MSSIKKVQTQPIKTIKKVPTIGRCTGKTKKNTPCKNKLRLIQNMFPPKCRLHTLLSQERSDQEEPEETEETEETEEQSPKVEIEEVSSDEFTEETEEDSSDEFTQETEEDSSDAMTEETEETEEDSSDAMTEETEDVSSDDLTEETEEEVSSDDLTEETEEEEVSSDEFTEEEEVSSDEFTEEEEGSSDEFTEEEEGSSDKRTEEDSFDNTDESISVDFHKAVMAVLDDLYSAPEEVIAFTSNDLIANGASVTLTEICFAGMLEDKGFQLYREARGQHVADGFYYTYNAAQQCFCLFEVYQQCLFMPIYVNIQYSPTDYIKLAGAPFLNENSLGTIFVLLYKNKALITFGDVLVTEREQRSLDKYRATWQPAPVKTKGKFTFTMEEAITIDCSRFTDQMRGECIDYVEGDLSMFIS
jgi:hypothetical protein